MKVRPVCNISCVCSGGIWKKWCGTNSDSVKRNLLLDLFSWFQPQNLFAFDYRVSRQLAAKEVLDIISRSVSDAHCFVNHRFCQKIWIRVCVTRATPVIFQSYKMKPRSLCFKSFQILQLVKTDETPELIISLHLRTLFGHQLLLGLIQFQMKIPIIKVPLEKSHLSPAEMLLRCSSQFHFFHD